MSLRRLKILISLLLFICTTTHAQADSVVIGKDINGNNVYANEIKLKCDITSVTMKENGDDIGIVMKAPASANRRHDLFYILQFNMKERKAIWSSGMKEAILDTRSTHHGMIIRTDHETRLLNNNDGSTIWSETIHPVYMDDSLDIIIGYNQNVATSSKIKALRLSTGEKLWDGKVKRQTSYTWNEITPMEDGKIMAIADSINIIDLKTGGIQTIGAITGYRNMSKAVLSILAGATGYMLGYALAGGFSNISHGRYCIVYYISPNGNYVSLGGPNTFGFTGGYDSNIISGLSSNVMHNDSNYYFADHYSLRCFSDNMQEIWKYEYPSNKSSYSQLFMEDDAIYMLNYGYGLFYGSERKKDSRPFIARINLKTGEEQMFLKLSAKKNIIEDAEITDHEAFYILGDGSVYQHDIRDTLISTAQWDTKKYGRLKTFVRDTLYTPHEATGGFMPIECGYGYFNIFTDKGYVVTVDNNLNIKKVYAEKDIYNICFKKNNCVGVYQKKKKKGLDIWIIRKQGLPMVHITQDVETIGCTDNLVYITNKNTIKFLEI